MRLIEQESGSIERSKSRLHAPTVVIMIRRFVPLQQGDRRVCWKFSVVQHPAGVRFTENQIKAACPAVDHPGNIARMEGVVGVTVYEVAGGRSFYQ